MPLAQVAESVLAEADMRGASDELIACKQAGEELAVAPPVEALTRFLEAELPNRGSEEKMATRVRRPLGLQGMDVRELPSVIDR